MASNIRRASIVFSRETRRGGPKGRLVVFALACFCAGGGGVALAQTTYYVATCGNDSWAGTSSTCSSPNGPKLRISAAVTASSSGDTIRILDGTYQGTGNKNITINKTLTIRSDSGDPADVIIDLQNSGRAFEVATSTLTISFVGLTIKNGNVGASNGGAIHSAGAPGTVTFDGCVFEACTAEYGGALYLEKRDHVIDSCEFRGNVADQRGGAVYIEPVHSITILDSLFEEANTAKIGGAIALNRVDGAVIRGCTVDGNQAENDGNGTGGGIAAEGCPELHIEDCIIANNSADAAGGGCHFVAWSNQPTVISTTPALLRCTFSGNAAGTGGGGGIYFESNLFRMANCALLSNTTSGKGGAIFAFYIAQNSTIANSVFARNEATQGGGVFLNPFPEDSGYLDITNCTFALNEASSSGAGGAIRIDTDYYEEIVRLRNNIFWDDTANGSSNEIVPASGLGAVTYNCVEGGYSGTGNIPDNPLFADAASNDYRLLRGSPGLDAADRDALPLDALDLDGDANTTEELPYDILDTARRKDHFCAADSGHGSGDKTDMGAYEANRGLIYVDKDATGGNDGSSWADAYTDLQNAFRQAGDDPAACEAWVAEGSYKPDDCTSCSGNRTSTFALVEGVGVYGGFAGTETERDERDPADHETILTGLIGSAGGGLYRVYHVVTAGNTITAATEFDGFTVKLGRADGGGTDQDRGAGLYIDGSPTLKQLMVSDNLGDHGAGVYLKSGNPTFTDCSFVDNHAQTAGGGVGSGGAMYIASGGSGNIEFLRCNLNNNLALDKGGGIYSDSTGAEPHFTNCLFYRNNANKSDTDTRGGAIYTNRKIVLLQCTFAKNWCGEENMGGAIYNAAGNSVLKTCILWKNFTTSSEYHDSEDDQIKIAGGTVTASFTSIENIGSLGGGENNDKNPQFQNFAQDDYELDPNNCGFDSCDSKSIDRGEDDDCTGLCDTGGGGDSGGDVKRRTRKVNLDNRSDLIDRGSLERPSGS
ncbi:MAG: hypothetical protein IT449_13420 [Phycisphaerales bacterium]|nr:hypothetical protein [Phycisphaerales bacterium]